MKIYASFKSDGMSMAEPVTIARANQETLPSVPLSRSKPRDTIGDSGTPGLRGIITEELNAQLQGVAGIRVFDEMRKTDATVRALLVALKLPVRRAKWFVNPASDDPKDVEIANFVEHALFEWIENITWDEFVSQALLLLDFGVMLFEKVYGIKNHEGKDYVTLTKLAPRLPKSIQQWELIDRTFGIQQIRQDGQLAQIPGDKLVIIVNEREGDNWWGTSILRAPYRHYYHKDKFYRIDAIAFERQGIGIPKVKMPASYTPEDEAKAARVAQNLRANEAAYALVPEGYDVEFMNMGSQTTRDPEKSINHHNRQILLSGLAQFLELGGSSGSTGSHALSNDHSDLFLKGEEAVANTIRDAINRQAIKELVDLNFDGVTRYPVLDYAGIKKEDVAGLANAYGSLVTSGGIKPIPDDEQYLRASLGLPPRTVDDDPTTEEQQDGIDDDTPGTGNDPEEQVDEAVTQTEEPAETPEEKAKPAAAAKKTEAKKKPVQKKTAHDHKLPRVFSENGFQSWRPLTFAEKKVNWKKIQDKMDALETGFTAEAKDVLTKAKESFMARLHDALKRNDQKAIARLEVEFADEYKAILRKTMREAYEFGKNNAAAEMGVNTPATDSDVLAAIELTADTIATKTVTDIEAKAKRTAVNALNQDKNILQTAGSIDAELDDVIQKSVDNTAGVLVGQGINNGRADTFEEHADKIVALQRSEILDDKTCNFCLSMDALVISPDDEWARMNTFHDWCRGIWVEILSDEENPPEVTGIPSDIGDYYGGQTNDLKQPKNPIVRPGSLAAQVVESQKNADRKK